MPTYAQYKKYIGGKTLGSARKQQSDNIMLHSWDGDISSRVGYFCDWYHDEEILQLNDLHPYKDKNKIPLDIKFVQSSSQTYDKDSVTVHLQLKPGQECNIPYYYSDFAERYGAIFPIGLYVIIQDESGIWNRWLVVDKANLNVTQFPTFEILRCDYVVQYIMNNTKVQIPGVLRSQNSYNSGIWTDYRVTTTEDVQKIALPLNRDTENIFYTESGSNLRMIIDGKIKTEPRCWKVTKVNRITPNGITRITLAQDAFDQHKDYIELDENGNVIGMWADYYSLAFEPKEEEIIKPNIYGEFKFTALPQVKVGGSYKKFTLHFYKNNEEISLIPGQYYFTIDGEDASTVVNTIIDNNILKIKFLGGDEYIGKVLKIEYLTDDGISTIREVEIVGL